MEFDEFVHRVDGAVRTEAPVERYEAAAGSRATWGTRSRDAAVDLVPPRNVSVTLRDDGSAAPVTTWYPIDAALVDVVSKRIAAHIGEA